MHKTTIFFYTNNFINKKILQNTIEEAVQHCLKNNALLLIASHYPLSENYIDVSENFVHDDSATVPKELEFLIVRDLRVDLCGVGVNYVVGKLPYKTSSILHQLIFSCKKCETENVILFEHDCFYPEKYIGCVEKALENHEISYCLNNELMVNKEGFFFCSPHAYLSSFSGKNERLKEIFEEKKRVYIDAGEKKVFLEPFIKFKNVKKSIRWKPELNRSKSSILIPVIGDPVEDFSLYNRNAAIVERLEKPVQNSFCLDRLLDGQPILELQHGVNTSNCLYLMRQIYDNVIEDKDELSLSLNAQTHPYWGNAKRFIDMMNFDRIDLPNEYLETIYKNGLQEIKSI